MLDFRKVQLSSSAIDQECQLQNNDATGAPSEHKCFVRLDLAIAAATHAVVVALRHANCGVCTIQISMNVLFCQL